jgi:hypothetical protein
MESLFERLVVHDLGAEYERLRTMFSRPLRGRNRGGIESQVLRPIITAFREAGDYVVYDFFSKLALGWSGLHELGIARVEGDRGAV